MIHKHRFIHRSGDGPTTSPVPSRHSDVDRSIADDAPDISVKNVRNDDYSAVSGHRSKWVRSPEKPLWAGIRPTLDRTGWVRDNPNGKRLFNESRRFTTMGYAPMSQCYNDAFERPTASTHTCAAGYDRRVSG